MTSVLTLTTDFGLEDAYVAALEAAALRVAPELRIVHISHLVPPGDIATAAYLLEYATISFAAGSMHLAVVDPGVGTDRPILAVSAGGFTVVGPDNGVLDRALRGRATTAVRLRSEATTGSHTFESRDVMAPAAARLAQGEPLEAVGQPVEFAAIAPPVEAAAGVPLRTSVAHVDGYGTVVLDVRVAGGQGWTEIRLGDIQVRWGRTFADVNPGELVAYPGSIGYLEVAVRDGQAATRLGLGTGDEVEIELS